MINLPPFVAQNPIMSGGILVTVGGSLMSYAKELPAKISDFLFQTFTVRVTITDDTAGFKWVKMWVSSNTKFSKKRRLDLHTPYINDDHKIRLSVAPGSHFFWYHHRPATIKLTRTEEKASGGGYGASKRTESFDVRILGRNRDILQKLLEETKEASTVEESKEPKIYFWDNMEWIETRRKLRSLDTVILSPGMKEAILTDMHDFLQSEAWYIRLGIPYHRGYLFYGKPGGGKTSLIMGLASELSSSIYFLKLNQMTDATLAAAMRDITPRSLVVMEDVDCVVPHRRAKGVGDKEEKEEGRPHS